jgi:hypothetical protein
MNNNTFMTMTAAEIDLLKRVLSTAKNYLEFGSGKSTELAVTFNNIEIIDVIESDADFLKKAIHENPNIAPHIASGRVRAHHVDIGKTTEWGYPEGTEKKESWPNYAKIIHSLEHKHDAILVDGRFRISCILEIVAKKYNPCVIVVHDFWLRNGYHPVLNFLNVLGSADTMGVFVPRQYINLQLLKQCQEHFLFYAD